MKHKSATLLKPLGIIIQESYLSFYTSEPFRILHFNMRHPVVTVKSMVKISSIFVAFLENMNFNVPKELHNTFFIIFFFLKSEKKTVF